MRRVSCGVSDRNKQQRTTRTEEKYLALAPDNLQVYPVRLNWYDAQQDTGLLGALLWPTKSACAKTNFLPIQPFFAHQQQCPWGRDDTCDQSCTKTTGDPNYLTWFTWPTQTRVPTFQESRVHQGKKTSPERMHPQRQKFGKELTNLETFVRNLANNIGCLLGSCACVNTVCSVANCPNCVRVELEWLLCACNSWGWHWSGWSGNTCLSDQVVFCFFAWKTWEEDSCRSRIEVNRV